jgi:hypothetical protein
MNRIVRLHRAHLLVLAALLGTVLSAGLLTTTASAVTAKTWTIGETLVKGTGHLNPAPDRFKDKAVWSYMWGEADTPSSYVLDKSYANAKQEKRNCGTQEFRVWRGAGSLPPGMWFNAGPAVEEGQDRCAPLAHYPADSFFMHPGLEAGPSNYAVARWKSPITGTITLSGSVQVIDAGVSGVAWQLDNGSAILAGPGEMRDTSRAVFGPLTIQVVAGESLYLEVGRAAGVSGSNDGTEVSLTITSS